LKLGRQRRSPLPATSPSFSLLPRLPRVVRKQPLPSFYFFPSRMPCRRSPAAGRLPPLASCRGHRSNRPCKHVFEFAFTPATRRSKPHMISWPGVPFRPTPARAPPPSHVRARPDVGSTTSGSDQPSPRVKPGVHRSIGVLLLKRPPVSYILQAGPSTLKNSYSLVLNFRFKPLSLLEFHTRGPEHPFMI
jgi:hypothetical protein